MKKWWIIIILLCIFSWCVGYWIGGARGEAPMHLVYSTETGTLFMSSVAHDELVDICCFNEKHKATAWMLSFGEKHRKWQVGCWIGF